MHSVEQYVLQFGGTTLRPDALLCDEGVANEAVVTILFSDEAVQRAAYDALGGEARLGAAFDALPTQPWVQWFWNKAWFFLWGPVFC